MFNNVKKIKRLKDIIKNQDEFIMSLREEADIWKNKYNNILEMSTPEIVLMKVMNRGIEWYDYMDLKHEERRAYYNGAQDLLRNNILANECNYIINDLIQEAGRQSKDFREVMDLRMSANGIELIKERLESIENPDDVETLPKENVGDSVL